MSSCVFVDKRLKIATVMMSTLLSAVSCLCPPAPLKLPQRELSAGQELQLSAVVDGQRIGASEADATPDKCEGFWYVNHQLYGNDDVGHIDRCGLYRAPDVIAERTTITLTGSPTLFGISSEEIERCERDCVVCYDCCPHVEATLTLLPGALN